MTVTKVTRVFLLLRSSPEIGDAQLPWSGTLVSFILMLCSFPRVLTLFASVELVCVALGEGGGNALKLEVKTQKSPSHTTRVHSLWAQTQVRLL